MILDYTHGNNFLEFVLSVIISNKKLKILNIQIYVHAEKSEVNVNPVLRSFHYLRVRSLSSTASVNKTSAADNVGNSTSSDYLDDLLPPNVESESTFDNFEESQLHSYEECCKYTNVSSTCLGFCTLQNILNGTAGVGK